MNSTAHRKKFLKQVIEKGYVDKNDHNIIRKMYYSLPQNSSTVPEKNLIKFDVDYDNSENWAHQMNKCVYIHFFDKYGYKKRKCLSKDFLAGVRKSHSHKIMKALREIVRPDVHLFGKMRGIRSGEQVDHVIPFSVLAKEFLKRYTEKEIDNLIINTKHEIVNDVALCEKWRRFHYEHAELQILDGKHNSAKANAHVWYTGEKIVRLGAKVMCKQCGKNQHLDYYPNCFRCKMQLENEKQKDTYTR